VKALKMQLPSGGVTKLIRLALAACLVAAAAGGCHRNGGVVSDDGINSADPQVAENLANLSREVRRAMHETHLSGNFEEFVAFSHVEVPPPPTGAKYAINKQWKVVLVHAK
jgi:hypothetical protein